MTKDKDDGVRESLGFDFPPAPPGPNVSTVDGAKEVAKCMVSMNLLNFDRPFAKIEMNDEIECHRAEPFPGGAWDFRRMGSQVPETPNWLKFTADTIDSAIATTEMLIDRGKEFIFWKGAGFQWEFRQKV